MRGTLYLSFVASLALSFFISDAFRYGNILANKSLKCLKRTNRASSLSNEVVDHPMFDRIAVSGLVKETSNFADSQVLLNVFGRHSGKRLKVISDSVKFARKRLVTPKSVYSGLIDNLGFLEADLGSTESMKNSLEGVTAWLAFNVTSAELPSLADLALASSIQRVLFAVREGFEEGNKPHGYEEILSKLNSSGIVSTIIRFRDFTNLAESRTPFRIRPGEMPVPLGPRGEQKILASGDLFRIIAEALDLPKTYHKVYSVGPGGLLDQEILIYLKAQGLSEAEQAAVLLGDFMDKIELRYKQEVETFNAKQAAKLSI